MARGAGPLPLPAHPRAAGRASGGPQVRWGLWRGGQGDSKYSVVPGRFQKKKIERRRASAGLGEESLPGFSAVLSGDSTAYSLCFAAVGKSCFPVLFSLLVC